MEKVDKTSTPYNDKIIHLLKTEFPEIFTEGKIDFAKLKETIGETLDDKPEKYTFSWAGKKDAIKLRLTPTQATLKPKKEDSINFEKTKNVFIEGDNLEVLKTLYDSYYKKIKLIYLDPPFNTGGDFIYPDDFSDPLETYLQLIGEIDENGNWGLDKPEKSGRFHSNWLTMMYPRLSYAKQLLSDDGAIFVEIDDNEIHNLRMLLNEIFGEENFITTIIWQKKFSPQNDAKWFSDNHDYILCYAKNKEIWHPTLLPRTEEHDSRYSNPDNDPRGDWTSGDLSVKTYNPQYDYTIITPSGRQVDPPVGYCWRVSKERLEELINDNRIWFGEEGNNVPRIKRFLSEVQQGIVPLTVWTYDEVGHNQEAKQELKELMDGIEIVFDTPKPIRLMKRIIHLGTNTNTNDIILDFFAGSCSTAHAVFEKNIEDQGNRKFIMIQLPEPTGNEKTPTIADYGKERIRRAGYKLRENIASTNIDLGFKAFKLIESNMVQWKGLTEQKLDEYVEKLEQQISPIKEGSNEESLLYEILLREGLELTSNIVKQEIGENNIFKIKNNEKEILICLDNELKQASIEQLGLDKNQTFILRDTAINDEQAANLALQCKLKSI